MHRLFSPFSSGPPGLGLLLLRLVSAVTLIMQWTRLHNGESMLTMGSYGIACAGGVLLLVGLWTPITGVVVALTELWILVALGADPWVSVMLAGLAAALALIGPGVWSADARLYGWKRIEIGRPHS